MASTKAMNAIQNQMLVAITRERYHAGVIFRRLDRGPRVRLRAKARMKTLAVRP